MLTLNRSLKIKLYFNRKNYLYNPKEQKRLSVNLKTKPLYYVYITYTVRRQNLVIK